MTTFGPFTFPNATTGDVDRFIYDGPVQTAAQLPAATGNNRNICWGNSADQPPSVDVGPEQGQGGGTDGFLFTETSSPGANGDFYYIEYDTALDASAESWQLTFYTNQHGPSASANGSFVQVQINESGGGWVNVGSQFGGTGDATTDGTAWTLRTVDLSNGGLNTDASTRVRIRIESQASTAWQADMGIDTITFTGTPLATADQEGFRWRDDDGSESAASWLDAQDVDITRGKEVNTRLRILVDYTGDPAAEQATLQYKRSDEAASEWRNL